MHVLTRILAAFFLLLALGVATPAQAQDTVVVDMDKNAELNPEDGNWIFSPETVTIAVGDTVTWRNDSPAPHTATENDESFDSGNIAPGEEYSQTFEEAGTYRYFCQYHEGQVGTVVVRAAGGEDTQGGEDDQAEDEDSPSVPEAGGGALAGASGLPWAPLAAGLCVLTMSVYALVRRR